MWACAQNETISRLNMLTSHFYLSVKSFVFRDDCFEIHIIIITVIVTILLLIELKILYRPV